MTSFGHNTVGAIIGIVVYQNSDAGLSAGLLVTFLIGLLSHYIADAIPHGHYRNVNYGTVDTLKTKLIPAADFTLSFTLLMVILGSLAPTADFMLYVLIGVLGSQLPDIEEVLTQTGLVKQTKFSRLHRHFHFDIVHWHNPPQGKKKYPAGRNWSYTDIWQLVPLSVLIILLMDI